MQQKPILTKLACAPQTLLKTTALCAALICPVWPHFLYANQAVVKGEASLNQTAQVAPALPSLGDEDAQDFSVSAERQVGARIMRDIRQDPDYSDDPQLLDYLQSLWQPLIAQARRSGQLDEALATRLAWEVFLVRDASVNAFALPGGYVGVHLGLIEVTHSGDELASVLAHEMSHITQRHIARQITQNRRQSLMSTAAMILGVLVASRANSADGVNAAIAGGQAASLQGQLNFSREMEREADRVGFAVMSGAGYAPSGMAEMFERLAQASRLNDSGAFPYLRSHPLTTERIGEARARLGAGIGIAPLPPLVGTSPILNTVTHALARARARVLMDTRAVALRRWLASPSGPLWGQGNLENGLGVDLRGADEAVSSSPTGVSATALQSALAVSYQRALSASLLRDFNRVDVTLQAVASRLRILPAQDAASARRTFDLLAVQSQLDRGHAAEAARLLQPYAADRSRPFTLLRAQAALAVGDAHGMKTQADALQTWVATQPSDAAAWAVLAQTWSRLAQPLRALRAEAESRSALGDLKGALDRLRQAQRLTRAKGNERVGADAVETAVIAARLHQWEQERREQARADAASR
jgi:beta-barrel assembly-enhancing protease